MTFTARQVDQLLKPINPSRILTDGKGHSHVSQQDVLAHLNRVFGFGNFDIDVLNTETAFETPRDEQGRRFDVCCRAMVRLTVRDPEGREVCHYENGSTATAQNQTRGDAHDLAYKSAISLSVKRAAIALGDQFGLSLYNKGQREALVRGTFVHPEKVDEQPGDIQEGVPQQVSLGNDEVEHEQDAVTRPDPAPKVDADNLLAAVESAPDVDTLRDLWRHTTALPIADRDAVQQVIQARLADLRNTEPVESDRQQTLDDEAAS